MKKRSFTTVFIALLLLIASCAGTAEVISVSEEELNFEVDRMMNQYEAQGANITEAQVQDMRSSLLEQIVERKLLVAAASSAGYSLEDGELDAELETVKSQFPDEEAYLNAISGYGYTEELLLAEISDALLIRKYIEEKIYGEIEVNEEEMQLFYQENPLYFETPETVTASHILIQLDPDADQATRTEAEQKINEVARRLSDGADFAEMAREYSEGPSGPNGGDLGAFERGQMVAPFEEAAFALPVGEVSEVVETQFGLHLIFVRERSEAGLIDFETARESIRNYLSGQKEQEAIASELERLRESYTIDVPEV